MAGVSQRAVQTRRRKSDLRNSAEARFPSRPGETACGRDYPFATLARQLTLGNPSFNRVVTNQPLTIGVDLSYKF